MEQRLAKSWRMTVNEKRFIEDVVLSNLRVDGRLPFDYRSLKIELGRKDGHADVQLGHTRVMSSVTCQLIQPYRDQPNEGTLSIFTEFSPMADPSFESGRPGELAIELGRIIDRGLRESRALDMESLCIVAGSFVWAVRIDLHILDNGGNLIDAANIAALAALLTFQRPECSVEEDDQVIIHAPEVREPLPLIVHHLPIAVTFGIFNEGNNLVVDPTYHEEDVMGGRITLTMNSSGDVCAIQKAGGEGVMPSVIMQCLHIASTKVAELESTIEKAVDAYNMGRIERQIKQQIALAGMEVSILDTNIKKNDVEEFRYNLESSNIPDKGYGSEKYAIRDGSLGTPFSQPSAPRVRGRNAAPFVGSPSNWDPHSKGMSADFIRKFMALQVPKVTNETQESIYNVQESKESNSKKLSVDADINTVPFEASSLKHKKGNSKTLKDAIKPKGQRRK